MVDDDEDVRESIVEALSDEGFDIVGVEGAAAALALLRAGAPPPAVILLDLMMPGMSGADFLVVQRADPELAAIPVVLLSADVDVRARAAELGVAEHLRKPFKLEVLVEVATRYVSAANRGS